MITFAPMSPLAVPRLSRLRPTLAAIALGTTALFLAAPRAHGQTARAYTEDASPVPSGSLRLSVANGWTRYNNRFAADGTVGLGDELSTDSLGPRQLPRLAPIEAALQTLANNPAQRLTLGKLDVRTDARIVTTPIALDYGFSRRLSLGFVIPIVQTRWAAQVRVNEHTPTDSLRRGNTGLIPVSLRLSAASTNAAVVTALTSASTSLTALLGRCQTNPSAAECNPIRGQEASAAAAARRAAEFATGVRTAYGVTEQTSIVAPLTGSALAAQIESERAALVAQLAAFSPGFSLGKPFNAITEFSYADFQGRNTVPGLLQTELGGGIDSIRTTETTGIGDVEVRAQYVLLDRMQTDSLPMRGLGYRLDLGGAFRFNTSKADTARNLTDIGTGEGPGAEFRSALEIVSGHVGGTIAARYWTSLGRTVDAALVGYPEVGFPIRRSAL